MRICIPIIAENEETAMEKMRRTLPQNPSLEILFELRMDRMREIKIDRLLGEKTKKIVVTNRRREEGGGFRGTEKERISFLLRALDLGADYVDVEASTEPGRVAEVKAAIADKDFKASLIVSSHDFVNPPTEKGLIQRLEESAALAPDIVKIVCRVDDMEDNLKMLKLVLLARERGQKIISFGMGAKGRMSRVMSLLLGAYMGFASLDKGEESAPGQLSLGEMITVLSILNGTKGELQGNFSKATRQEQFRV